jgi:hypothetical protein
LVAAKWWSVVGWQCRGGSAGVAVQGWQCRGGSAGVAVQGWQCRGQPRCVVAVLALVGCTVACASVKRLMTEAQ